MDLPSFLWLWRIAAWSMGFVIAAYGILAATGSAIAYWRRHHQPYPGWLRSLHVLTGLTVIILVLLLLTIGVVGTLGHFGSLGHSPHLVMGLTVVAITLASAWSATRIGPDRPWARSLHLSLNGLLFLALALVSWTGWTVVQKYLP